MTSFEKWEGLGNDFVVIRRQTPAALPPDRVRELCDRRRGVGADGVLVVEERDGMRPTMVVYNADGSRPEMCGNGLRCVAAYLARGEGEGEGEGEGKEGAAAREVIVATDAGEKRCLIQAGGPVRYDVTVEMGVARIGGEISVVIDGREHRFLAVDVGNPHAITFETYDEELIDRVAPLVATSQVGGINVEFCRAYTSSTGARIDVVVWERGVGRTLACGTGACAVAAAACETGRAPFGAPIQVSLPGGDLEITVGAERRDLVMSGPARRVFAGDLVGL